MTMNSTTDLPYDTLALEYDDRAVARTKLVAEVLRRTTPLEAARVLDLGVGTGLIWEYLGSAGAPDSVVGVDLSSGMLKRARSRRNPRMRLVRADFGELPFHLQEFDIVLLAFSARHASDLTGTLRQAASTLTHDGHLMLIEYSGQTQLQLAGAVMQCYVLLADALDHTEWVPQSYFAACRVEELLSAATEAGFNIKSLTYESVVEADGCEGVVNFVMNSPPVAFDLIRCHRSKREEIRSRLIADCRGHLLPNRVSSNILFCTMDRPNGE